MKKTIQPVEVPVSALPDGKRAEYEIDSRLAQAIRDRADAMKKVAALSYWNTRLTQIEQEIQSLLGYQRSLSGAGPIPVPGSLASVSLPSSIPYVMGADIPQTISSIPAKREIQLVPNAAELVAQEGGFQ